MDRCHLKGSKGDALHAMLCAAGFNIRWLLRMIAKMGLGLLLCLLSAMGLLNFWLKLAELIGHKPSQGSHTVLKVKRVSKELRGGHNSILQNVVDKSNQLVH